MAAALRKGTTSGILASSPILLEAFQRAQQENEDQLMSTYLNASREKQAAPGDIASLIKETLLKETVGAGVGALFSGLGAGVGALQHAFLTEPKRQQLLTTLLSSDPVLADAVAANPDMRKHIIAAYATLVKFAPSISTDINAVRAFLREAAMGGGHVNYATIKNLAETEKNLRGGK